MFVPHGTFLKIHSEVYFCVPHGTYKEIKE
jgi:hypothetical protein